MDATTKEWHELIPYLSEAQIRTALKKLKKTGMILVRNYNTDKHHKTAIDY